MSNNQFSIFNEKESKVRSYCLSFPTIFERSVGSKMFDTSGEAYIDFVAGAGSLNYGHNNPEIKRKVMEYIENDGITLSLDMYSQSKKEFLETFSNTILKPRNMDYKLQFTSPTGTSVVESAVKLARKVTNRQNIVCFTNAFHGMSGTSLSLTGNQHHRQSFSQSQVTRLPFENYINNEIDSINYYRKLFTDPSSGVDIPAAVILETTQAEGGLNVASNEWLQGLRKLTLELDILLIIDDIQTGCGRTTSFFSFERAQIQPDMVCLSKSISGMGFPMALLLLAPSLDVWKPAEDNGTFRGNNIAFVASKAMIEKYWLTSVFEGELKEKEALIKKHLMAISKDYNELVKGVKGIGLLQGLEMHDKSSCKFIINQCFEQGLLIETCGPNNEIIKLMPALTIELQTLKEGLAILSRAFMSLHNGVFKTELQLHENVG